MKFKVTIILIATIIFNVTPLFTTISFSQEEDPNNMTLISKLMTENEYEKAVKVIDEALKTDVDNVNLLLLKAKADYFLKKHPEALTLLDKVNELTPNKAESWYLKGLILFELGDYDNAILAEQESLKLAPEYLDAKTTYCSLLSEINKHEELKSCLKELKELQKSR